MISILLIGGLSWLIAVSLGAAIVPDRPPGTGAHPRV
jgi:hypothetical protein